MKRGILTSMGGFLVEDSGFFHLGRLDVSIFLGFWQLSQVLFECVLPLCDIIHALSSYCTVVQHLEGSRRNLGFRRVDRGRWQNDK